MLTKELQKYATKWKMHYHSAFFSSAKQVTFHSVYTIEQFSQIITARNFFFVSQQKKIKKNCYNIKREMQNE